MLLKLFPKLSETKLIRILHAILYSPFLALFVGVFLVLSETFSLEFIAFYVLISLSIVIPSLLCRDMTPMIPLSIMLNIGISETLANAEATILLGQNLPHFIAIIALCFVFGIGRMVFDIVFESERRRLCPRFLIGYGLLLLGFTLGGLFTPYIDGRSVEFGFREFAALGGMYIYFFYTIDWKRFNPDFLFYSFLIFALAVSAEVIIAVVQSGGEVVAAGWGGRNDLGATIATAGGAVGYFILKKKAKISWLFVLAWLYLLVCVGLTQSRASFLAYLFVSMILFVLTMALTERIARTLTSLLTISFFIAFVLLASLNKEWFEHYFGRLVNFDFDSLDEFSSGRITIWERGLSQFTANPLFGVGWYQNHVEELHFAARYHSTPIQLLASTGIFGTGGYLFHRFQTVYMIFKRRSLEKIAAGLLLLGLLSGSLLDCFLFNIWLGFSYGLLLVFVEKMDVIPYRPFAFVTKKIADHRQKREASALAQKA